MTCSDKAGSARLGLALHGWALLGTTWFSKAGVAVWAWLGSQARCGSSPQSTVGHGQAQLGAARQCKAGAAGRCGARLGTARRGMARYGAAGAALLVKARLVTALHVSAGQVWLRSDGLGRVGLGIVGQSGARHSEAGMALLVPSSLCAARLVMARQVRHGVSQHPRARLDSALQGRRGPACPVPVWPSVAWPVTAWQF